MVTEGIINTHTPSDEDLKAFDIGVNKFFHGRVIKGFSYQLLTMFIFNITNMEGERVLPNQFLAVPNQIQQQQKSIRTTASIRTKISIRTNTTKISICCYVIFTTQTILAQTYGNFNWKKKFRS